MIRAVWRKLWCRFLGHAFRNQQDAAPSSPAHWRCVRCGFLPCEWPDPAAPSQVPDPIYIGEDEP